MVTRAFAIAGETPVTFMAWQRGVYGDIHAERIRAHAKHDPLGHSMERAAWDYLRWLPVLVEEVGECARVLCDMPTNVYHAGTAEALQRDRAIAHLREELVQVAAMAAAWADAIEAAQ